MKVVQCYEIFGGIALKNHAFLDRKSLGNLSYICVDEHLVTVTLTRIIDIPYCYNIEKRLVRSCLVHGILPILENFRRMCHVLRKNRIYSY